MSDHLKALLERIRDGEDESSILAEARALLAHDERFPAELRAEVALEDEAVVESAGLLGLLGEPMGELADALGHEAGELDLASGVLAAIAGAEPEVARAVALEAGHAEVAAAVTHRVGGQVLPVEQAVAHESGHIELAAMVTEAIGGTSAPIDAAVRWEAGQVEVAPAVSDAIGETSVPMAAAVRAEAGAVDVVPLLAEILGEVAPPLAAAVRGEAGGVDVWPQVAEQLGLATIDIAAAVGEEAGSVDIVEAVMREVAVVQTHQAAPMPAVQVEQPLSQPAAANNNAALWSGLVLAAAALFAVLVGNLPWSAAPPSAELVFASAGEIQIDALEYDAETMVHVVQGEAEQAPLIIWVDEEAVL